MKFLLQHNSIVQRRKRKLIIDSSPQSQKTRRNVLGNKMIMKCPFGFALAVHIDVYRADPDHTHSEEHAVKNL
jgi:hypothetical protein